METTPNVGLHIRGPLGWYGQPGEYLWDFDDNMQKIDSAIESLEQAITALGGSVGGSISLDSGTF